MLLSVRLDKDLFNRIELLSSETKRPKSFYIKEALKSYLDNFDISRYDLNKETLNAIKDIQEDKNLIGPFNNVDDLMKALND